MRLNQVRAKALLLFLTCGSAQAAAQAAATPYPRMAPLAEYLTNRDVEIALARSAAPASIAGGAAKDAQSRQTVLLIPVGRWSDGTIARPLAQ